MIEGIKKFGRMLRRDHFNMTATATAFGVFPVIATVIGLATGALLPWIAAGVVMSGVLAGSFVAAGEWKARRTKEIDLGFHRYDGIGLFAQLSGPGKKMSIVHNTQKMLDRLTRKHMKEQQLPPETLAKFAPYLKDAEEAAREVKCLVPQTPIELPKFEYLRKYFNAAGQIEKETVAFVPLPYTPAPWEVERQAREEAERRRAVIEQEIAAMGNGSARDMTVRRLRLKPKSGPSQSPG